MAFGDTINTYKANFASGEVTVNITNTPTAGNLLVLGVGRASTHAAGGTWGTPTDWNGPIHDTGINTGNMGAAWWWKISDGTETSVTTNGTNAGGNSLPVVAEFEGPFEASPFDVSVEDASGISTVTTSRSTGTTATTAQSDELAVAFFAGDRYDTLDGTRAYTNSFTEVVIGDGSSARATSILAKKVLSATGAVECTFSCVDTGDEIYGSVATFKKAASGTTYNQSAGGTLTSAGTLSRSTLKIIAGSSTPVGALLKLTATLFSGGSTPSGTVTKHASKAFTGELTSSGALDTIRLFVIALDGTLTSAGTLVKSTAKSFTGTLSTDGVLSKLISKLFTGTATSAGTIAKEAQKSLSGTATSAGTLSKLTSKIFSGTLSSAGAISKLVNKSLAGAWSFVGTLATLFSGSSAPATPSGTGGVFVSFSQRLKTIQVHPTVTTESERTGTIQSDTTEAVKSEKTGTVKSG